MKFIENFFFLFIYLFIIHTQITAQIKIDGTIVDAEFNPINNALVETFQFNILIKK